MFQMSRRQFLAFSGAAFIGSFALPRFGMTATASDTKSPYGIPCACDDIEYKTLELRYLRYGSWNSQPLSPQEIRVFGWFLCEGLDGSLYAPPCIYCIIDQDACWKSVPRLPRPDVVKAHPEVPLISGFEFRLPVIPSSFVSVWVLDNEGGLWQGRGNIPERERERERE